MSITTETLEPTPPYGLLAQYTPPVGVYDELLGPDLRPRPTWARFAEGLQEGGAARLAQRFEQTRRLLRENGVRYNVHGAPQGPDRPWELDPIPLLLAQREWAEVSAGLIQRARVLNAVLADIYGPQELLERGLLPPELVFGHMGFLLPCHGIGVPQKIHLHLYSSHIARTAGNQWTVLSDRTQGPSGTGFALENRIVASRILPDEFHGLYVERLASFFMTLRETLLNVAPQHRENPRVVLLSPGPRSPTYFEDTYLARYLGYTLVEGGDLTVRGTTVYLKTLGGLLPVDVILRRLTDTECDPLELRADSLGGVSGLVQAARSGTVAIANSLGSGFLEAPALSAFLPAICRQLFDEDLKLPALSTWWCGREEDLQYVEAHFDELVIRPAIHRFAFRQKVVAQLTARQREELLGQIRQRPADYVAQTRAMRSTAPVWNNGALQPWYVSYRTYVVADRDGGYQVMPGALARVAPTIDQLNELLAPGQWSKDVWILSDRPVPKVSLLRPPAAAVELRRSVNDLPSRVADNLYWLGRHLERAEGMVRQLRTATVRLTSELEPAALPELILMVAALSDDGPQPDFRGADFNETIEGLEAEVLSFLFLESRPGAFYDTLRSLYHTAAIVRDRISVDTWRIVNQLDLDLLYPSRRTGVPLGDVLTLMNQVLNLLSALSGLGTESMTRGPGWRFLDMGRRLERALHTSRLLRRTLVHSPSEVTPLLEALLEIADSSMTYRYRYLATLQLAPVLDLLLIDETNPRSVGFQVNALSDHVHSLPSQAVDSLRNRESRVMIAMQAALRLVDVEDLAHADPDGARRHLDVFLTQLISHLWQLSDSITHTYFTHTGPSRQLGSV